MPRLLSAANMIEKNRVESSHALIMLAEFTIPGAPGPYRVASYDRAITFHGLTFQPFPFDVDSLEDANSMALVRLRLTILNTTQEMQSLLENYWGPDSPWLAAIWYPIDAEAPDEVPYGAGEVFLVAQVSTDLMNAVVDLVAEGITLTASVPKRRYTESSNFRFIPRRTG